MVIPQEQIPLVWQGIKKCMEILNITPAILARVTGYSEETIRRGCRNGDERLASYMLPVFVDAFGLRNARNRSFEDTADLLTDEECIELLTEPLRQKPHQSNMWD
jgi:hypothetical protein